MRLKIAEVDPIPSARAASAIAVTPGALRITRQAKRRSCPMELSMAASFKYLAGINFLAFQRLKLYIHLRPTKDRQLFLREGHRLRTTLLPPHHAPASPFRAPVTTDRRSPRATISETGGREHFAVAVHYPINALRPSKCFPILVLLFGDPASYMSLEIRFRGIAPTSRL